jgi:CheY-like chemotaxis protein
MQTHKRILLIEDDLDDQLFFKEAICSIGDTELLYIANNGLEALVWLNSTTQIPDLIFSDINMPLMDGIECYSEILKNKRTSKIPVVFLSSDTYRINLLGEMGIKVFIKKGGDDYKMSLQIKQAINLSLMNNSTISPLHSKYLPVTL